MLQSCVFHIMTCLLRFLCYIIIFLNLSHSFHHYPDESVVSLGSERRGCFEPPSEDKIPRTSIDCQDIIPTENQQMTADHDKMNNDSQVDHPDSSNSKR